MVKSTIEKFMIDNMTAERYGIVTEADALLQQIGLTDQESLLVEIANDIGVYPASDVIDRMVAVYDRMVETVLNIHDVRLFPDMLLRQKTELLRGLLILQDYEDYDTLSMIVDTSPNNEEAFADIMSEVIALESESVLPFLASVGGGLIDSILTVNTPKVLQSDSPPIANDVRAKIIARMTGFKDWYNSLGLGPNDALTQFENGLLYGLLLDTYLQMFQPISGERTPDDAAICLYVWALAAADTEEPLSTARSSITRCYDDPTFTSQVMASLNKVHVQVTGFNEQRNKA